MTKLVIRHGLSEANNYKNYGTPAFDNAEAPLMPKGIEQSALMGERLAYEYGIEVATEPVAVSMMHRTQQTAIAAGFRWLHICPELNEEKGGHDDATIKQMLLDRVCPDATLTAVRRIIEEPPAEKVWVIHAYLIAALCQELGVYEDARFTPTFCEIRELSL